MMDKYLIFCEVCSHKQFVKDPQELKAVPRPNIPVPPNTKIQPNGIVLTNKEIAPKIQKDIPQPVMTKCPNCGRGVTVKKISEAYTKTEKQIRLRLQKEKDKASETKN